MRFKEAVNDHYDKLNDTDLHILKYIAEHQKECCALKIAELANRCNISKSTLLRFAQKLGYAGYSEFKAFLKMEASEEFTVDTDNMEKLYLDLRNTLKNLNPEKIRRICRLIYHADRVFVHGTGAVQASIAQEMVRVFRKTRKFFCIIDGGDSELIGFLPDMTAKDVLIIITLAGNREYLKQAIRTLAMRDIPYISISRFSNNDVASNTPHNLYVSTTQFHIGQRVHESTSMFFVLVDILFREYVRVFSEKNQKPDRKAKLDE